MKPSTRRELDALTVRVAQLEQQLVRTLALLSALTAEYEAFVRELMKRRKKR